MYKIGIDLGGTKTEIILLKANSYTPIMRKRIPTATKEGYFMILKNIAKLVKGVRENIPKKAEVKIGIGIPGFVEEHTGKILQANTQCLNGKAFKVDLEKLLEHKILVSNDANCFALSEVFFGAAKGYNLALGVIMGTGMGGGLIYQKKIISGLHGYAGEIGHTSFFLQGKNCFCGQKGCNETLLSGTGIQEKFFAITGKKLSVPEIYDAYLLKDKQSTAFVQNLIQVFGFIFSNLIVALNPQIIIIGGGVSNLPIWYQEGLEEIKKNLDEDVAIPKIMPNKLGDSSGVFGAALLA